VAYCTFDGNNTRAVVTMYKGDVSLPDEYASTHNWIHHNSFIPLGDREQQ